MRQPKRKLPLPELTAEQAEQIIAYLKANYDDDSLDWDNYCCTSEVAPDAYQLAVDTFAKAYGVFKEEKCDSCYQEETDGHCTNKDCEAYEDPEDE
jgi:hypothetical protein